MRAQRTWLILGITALGAIEQCLRNALHGPEPVDLLARAMLSRFMDKPQDAADTAIRKILERVDARVRAQVRNEWGRRRRERLQEPLSPNSLIVLAGHRSAGKSSLLPLVAQALDRPSVDLDKRIAEQHQRPLREWVLQDEPGFRRAERETFLSLTPTQVVAVGGGFLSLHPDLLTPHFTAIVPISFETYVERLSRDQKRPRLRPELSLDEELRLVYQEREAKHARGPGQPLWRLFQLMKSLC
ncbi:MAG: shikimate kinase [Myxococcaceae bacterium]